MVDEFLIMNIVKVMNNLLTRIDRYKSSELTDNELNKALEYAGTSLLLLAGHPINSIDDNKLKEIIDEMGN